MKTRTMIYLNPEEHRKLKTEAGKRRVSMAELMRQLVRHYFEHRGEGPPASADALLKIISLGSSGRSDVSVKHDNYLAKVLEREHSR
jgi:hypothetical protein